MGNAFSHGLVGCEMKDALNGIAAFGALAKKRLQRRSISHINRMEGHLVATEFPDPVHGLHLRIVQVVQEHRSVPGFVQSHRSMAANVPGSAGDQHMCLGGWTHGANLHRTTSDVTFLYANP